MNLFPHLMAAPTIAQAAGAAGVTLLAPGAALTAAAVAFPVLLAFYFLKLRRRPVRVSSTLLWERAARDLEVNAPFRMIRPSLLLLLQALALGLLCAALGRPTIAGGWAPTGRVAILIDRSASMSARDGVGQRGSLMPDGSAMSRLDEAKRRARELVDRLDLASGGTRAVVIEFAASARVVAPMSADRSALLRAIEGVTPSDQRGRLAPALALARAFAPAGGDAPGSEAPSRRERMTLALFSDGSFEDESESLGVDLGSAARRLERVGPAMSDPPADWRNLGLTALAARRDEDDPAIARVFLRAIRAGAGEGPARIVFRVNGETARALEVAIPPGPDGGRRAEEQASVDLSAPGRALIEARIVTDDLLGSDDAASLLIEAPGGPGVMVVAPADETTGSARADPALVEALEAIDGATVRVISVQAWEADPSAADLVVFDRVEARTLPRGASLHLGAGAPALGVRVVRAGADGEAGAGVTRALAWRRDHPLLRHVSLDGLFIGGRVSVEAPAGSGAEALASGPHGPLLLSVERAGVRRALAAFDTTRTFWWTTPAFGVFLTNASDWLTGLGAAAGARSFRTDEAITLRAEPGADVVRVEGPTSVDAPVSEADGVRRASVGALERAGVYRAIGAVERERLVPVNVLDGGESALATSERAAGFETAASAAASGPGARAVDADARREIWHWLVLAALALLCAEWWLYAWRSRV